MVGIKEEIVVAEAVVEAVAEEVAVVVAVETVIGFALILGEYFPSLILI